jgi:O-glycosyl hydrolase
MFKENVGAEPAVFSFNESNLGINVLMSPEDHRDMLKRLGAHFKSLGLTTKLLVGDANEPRAVDYVNAALADPEAMKYVGMVSYHSWNGGTDEQLVGWRDHARRAGVPLIVAEAGTDPDAHQYRNIISERWYAVEEAENNLRCLTLSQPVSIMHWQLTPDYGMVSPGKNESDPIQPSRRWWQFKQLADLSPVKSAIFPARCDRSAITVAALGDARRGASVVHLSNVGAERKAIIVGLPAGEKQFRLYVTDAERDMKELDPLNADTGTVELTVPAQSFVTLVADTR